MFLWGWLCSLILECSDMVDLLQLCIWGGMIFLRKIWFWFCSSTPSSSYLFISTPSLMMLLLHYSLALVSSKTKYVKKVYTLLLERKALLNASNSKLTWKVFMFPWHCYPLGVSFDFYYLFGLLTDCNMSLLFIYLYHSDWWWYQESIRGWN